MKLFRKQLATILHDSVLNEIRGTPEPEPIINGDNSDVIMYDKTEPQPNEVSQAHVVANDLAPSRFVPKLPIKPELPINKNKLVSNLRNYIMSIDDEDSLK